MTAIKGERPSSTCVTTSARSGSQLRPSQTTLSTRRSASLDISWQKQPLAESPVRVTAEQITQSARASVGPVIWEAEEPIGNKVLYENADRDYRLFRLVMLMGFLFRRSRHSVSLPIPLPSSSVR